MNDVSIFLFVIKLKLIFGTAYVISIYAQIDAFMDKLEMVLPYCEMQFNFTMSIARFWSKCELKKKIQKFPGKFKFYKWKFGNARRFLRRSSLTR